MLNYLFGNLKKAVEYVGISQEYARMVPATLLIPISNFYGSLAQLSLFTDYSTVEQENILVQVEQSLEKLQHLAQNAPVNYQHKVDLVEAEKCRVLNQKLSAIELYDKSIAGAKENEYIHEVALANELAAKFYLEWGKE